MANAYMEGVLGLAPVVDVIHVEPIGWQMRDQLRLGTRHGAAIGNIDSAHGEQTNQNYWKLVLRFEKDSKLTVDEADPEMCGWGFADWGTYSLVRFHKHRAGEPQGAVATFLAGNDPGPVVGSIGGPCIACGTIRNARKEDWY